jgi:hypothetical protein
MVNDDDYDLVPDRLLHHFVQLYRILICSNPLVFQTNGNFLDTSGVKVLVIFFLLMMISHPHCLLL